MNPFELRGPEFIFFYVVLSTIVLLVTWLIRKTLDGRINPALQSPQTLVSDPYVIAHLRRGPSETLRVAAASLLDRRLLEIESRGNVKTAAHVRPEHARKHLERAILDFYATGGPLTKLSQLKGATAEYDRQLQNLRLLPDAETRGRRWMLFLFMALILGGTGAAKIAVGVSRDKPVLYLILLMLAVLVLLFFVAHSWRTSHGDSFLRSVQRLFSGLRARADSISPGGATADLALLAAAFGVASLPIHVAPFKNQFYPAAAAGSSSSCGSSSSSCSGSSCGGGCGGGGCGGCGS